MQRPDLELLSRQIVPGTGPLRLQFLADGLYHDSYRVWRDQASFLLRVAHESAAGARERAWELLLLKAAQAAYLAPVIEHADATSGVLLYRWVEGRFWSDKETKEPVRVAQAAALIRAIQALPVIPGRFMRPQDWIDKYRMAHRLDGQVASAELAGLAEQRLKSLGAPTATAICHSDLHRFNLLEPAQAESPNLVVLDWEYAHEADVYWDLAGWSANNDFDHALRLRLLEAYLHRPASPGEMAHLSDSAWLYDYVCLLWCELYLTLQPVQGVERFAQRAALLEKRLC